MTDLRLRRGVVPPAGLVFLLFWALAEPPVPQAAAPPLELKVGGAWLRWRTFEPSAPAARDTLLDRALRWEESQPGLRIGTFEVRTAGRVWRNSVALVEIDPTGFRFMLAALPGWERRLADEWVRDTGVVVAVNTGLFRDDGTPQGLVLMDGVRRSPPAGWLDALVVLDGGVLRLMRAGTENGLAAAASAFQTLPWLIERGRVVFGTTSGVRLSRTHRDRRLTLCLGGDGLVRILLSNFEVFGQSAGRIPVGLTLPEQAVIAAAVGCAEAVALDGGISAQLVVRGEGRLYRMPGWRRVPLMMLLRKR